MTTTIPPSGITEGPDAYLRPGAQNGDGPGPDRGSRRISWVLLGVLLVAGAILAFVLVMLAGNERTPILVAGTEIEAGSVIEVSDVVVAQVAATDVNFVTRAERDLVVGQRARTSISAGTPLTPELIVEADRLPAGQAVVGAVLTAGEYPASAISLGDQVVLMNVPNQGSGRDDAVEIGQATIWAIEPVAEQSEPRFFISFVVPSELQLDVATAAGQGRLRVSLVEAS